jgi:MFS family permease
MCLFGTALGYLVLGLADTLALLITAIVLDGLTGATLSTAQAYIADSTTVEERAYGLGLIGAAFGLGMICGPALGGVLSIYGLHVPALVAACIALSNVAFGFFVLPESLSVAKRTRPRLRMFNPVVHLQDIVRIDAIRYLLVTVFMLNLAFSGLQSNFPLFSNVRFGWSATNNAVFFAFVGVCAVLTQGVLLGKIQTRYGEPPLVIGGLTAMVVGLGLLAVVPYAWLLFPVVGLVAFGSGLAIPALTSLISRGVDAQRQGQVMGGLQSLLSVTMIVGPMLAGLAFDYLGAAAPYWIGSLCALSALVVTQRARQTRAPFAPTISQHTADLPVGE